jgi:hypothetical protein
VKEAGGECEGVVRYELLCIDSYVETKYRKLRTFSHRRSFPEDVEDHHPDSDHEPHNQSEGRLVAEAETPS